MDLVGTYSSVADGHVHGGVWDSGSGVPQALVKQDGAGALVHVHVS